VLSGRAKIVVASAALAMVAAACSSSSHQAKSTSTTASTATAAGSTTPSTAAAGASTSSSPGVTPSTVTVGLITSLTGPAATESANIAQGAKARIDQQNAEGGVNGRQIKLVVRDDLSTPTGNLSASQELVQQEHAFSVIDDSTAVYGGYKILQQQGVPVTGGAWDGIEWGTQPNTNMFSWSGLRDPTLPQASFSSQYFKQKGVTNMAVVSWGSPSSAVQAAKVATAALKYEGLKVGYTNYTVPLGSADMTAVALAMKQAGVDGLLPVMGDISNIALIVAANQAGLHLKAATVPSGYGQTLLGNPTAVQALQGTAFTVQSAPVEINTAATKAWQDALAKYVHFTGVPGFDYEHGWLSTDLMIKGLEVAGQDPTRQSFISNLRQVTGYTAGGLLPTAINFTFGQDPTPGCGWFVVLKGKEFVPDPANGSPLCGPLIPFSALAKYM
jgi:branched-chain amino acid transport system substrate-binding protein